jgi:hypothetical protein
MDYQKYIFLAAGGGGNRTPVLLTKINYVSDG